MLQVEDTEKKPKRGCQVQYPVLVPGTAGCDKITSVI